MWVLVGLADAYIVSLVEVTLTGNVLRSISAAAA